MEEVKSKGKLKGFVTAITGAAQVRADAVRAEADEQERAAIASYRTRAEAEGRQKLAQALAEAQAGEEKRDMTETLAARRSRLGLREGCQRVVIADVRQRLKRYPDTPEYAAALEKLLLQGLEAIPGAKRARVLLRSEDISHKLHLKAAAPDVELSFAEGFFELGGLIVEFPDEHRRADLTFDTALDDLAGRFAEITGFGMEGADGK